MADLTGIGSVADLFGKIADKIFPDATAAAAAKAAYQQAEQSGELQTVLAQLDIDKAEAGGNWFTAGWRPFVGWVCGFGLAYQFLFFPLFSHLLNIVALDVSQLMQLLLGMLGMAVLRSQDKKAGVAS